MSDVQRTSSTKLHSLVFLRPQNPPDPTQSLRAEGSTQHNYKSPLTKISMPLPQGGYCYIKISIGSVVQGEPM